MEAERPPAWAGPAGGKSGQRPGPWSRPHCGCAAAHSRFPFHEPAKTLSLNSGATRGCHSSRFWVRRDFFTLRISHTRRSHPDHSGHIRRCCCDKQPLNLTSKNNKVGLLSSLHARHGEVGTVSTSTDSGVLLLEHHQAGQQRERCLWWERSPPGAARSTSTPGLGTTSGDHHQPCQPPQTAGRGNPVCAKGEKRVERGVRKPYPAAAHRNCKL